MALGQRTAECSKGVAPRSWGASRPASPQSTRRHPQVNCTPVPTRATGKQNPRRAVPPALEHGTPRHRRSTLAHRGRLVGQIHRENPVSAGIEAERTRTAFGLLEPFLALPRVFSEPLHTREGGGSIPTVPIKIPANRQLFQHGSSRWQREVSQSNDSRPGTQAGMPADPTWMGTRR
jgi:hypothetical protein